MDRADPVLRAFLKRACDAERNLVSENKVSKVWALTSEGVDGELAEVEGREIHLVLSRGGERRQPQNPQQASQWADRWRRAIEMPRQTPRKREEEVAPIYMTAMHPPDWYRRKGGSDLLQRLDEKPSRFTELLSNMDVSRATLGSRIREAKDMGLIYKTTRENGYTAWSLTARGEEETKRN